MTAADEPHDPAVAVPHGVLRTLVLAEHPPRLWSIPELARSRRQLRPAGWKGSTGVPDRRSGQMAPGIKHPMFPQRIDERARQRDG